MEKHEVLKKKLIESEFSFLKKGKIYPLNEIYLKVQSLYPKLCDDNDIRIKDGYTIKWKWYIRFALDQLKKKNKSQNYEMIPIVGPGSKEKSKKGYWKIKNPQ